MIRCQPPAGVAQRVISGVTHSKVTRLTTPLNTHEIRQICGTQAPSKTAEMTPELTPWAPTSDQQDLETSTTGRVIFGAAS